MARKITKAFETTTTGVTYRILETNDDGSKALVTKCVTLNGSRTEKSARLELEKLLGTKNFMLVAVEKPLRSGDGLTYEMDAQTFITYSDVCEDGASYSREFVTATFKVDVVWFYTLDGTYERMEIEHTTTRKQRAAIAELLGTEDFIIDTDASTTIDVRRYMTRETFVEIGRIVK